jgi:hypothetical protein
VRRDGGGHGDAVRATSPSTAVSGSADESTSWGGRDVRDNDGARHKLGDRQDRDHGERVAPSTTAATTATAMTAAAIGNQPPRADAGRLLPPGAVPALPRGHGPSEPRALTAPATVLTAMAIARIDSSRISV